MDDDKAFVCMSTRSLAGRTQLCACALVSSTENLSKERNR